MFLERCCFVWLLWVSCRDHRDDSQMGSVLLVGWYGYAMPENSALLLGKLIKRVKKESCEHPVFIYARRNR